MAKVANWNPNVLDEEIFGNAMDRLRECAELVAKQARSNLSAQIGRGKTSGISHPPYKKGQAAGMSWTARRAGALMKSIRVVERKPGAGFASVQIGRNIWVMAGNYDVYYAQIFEYKHPFLRPALNQVRSQMKAILEGR